MRSYDEAVIAERQRTLPSESGPPPPQRPWYLNWLPIGLGPAPDTATVADSATSVPPAAAAAAAASAGNKPVAARSMLEPRLGARVVTQAGLEWRKLSARTAAALRPALD
jgi:hypothetical protein